MDFNHMPLAGFWPIIVLGALGGALVSAVVIGLAWLAAGG